MKTRSKSAPLWIYWLFAFLFSIQVVPRFWWDSLTNDEPIEVTNGYYYLTHGDAESPHNHPPLAGALNALPLLFLNLKTLPCHGDVMDRSQSFFFDWNLNQVKAMTLAARPVSWLLGCALGFLLFWVTRPDRFLSIVVLLLWAFDPTLLALAGVAKNEIAPAFFFLAAVLMFRWAKGQESWKAWGITGLAVAMAVTCKFYCLVLLPVFGAMEFLRLDKGFSLVPPSTQLLGSMGRRWFWGLVGFFLWIFLLYLPATLLLPDHREPFSYFFSKFKENVVYAHDPMPVYFMGVSSLENHWYYLPVAFALKEPIAFLVLTVLGVFLAFARKIVLPPWQWLPPLFFFLAMLPTLNLGVRYLLPALPFLFLVAGQAGVWLWNKTGKKVSANWRLGVLGLGLWQVASVGFNFPHAISYFNELVAPGDKIQFLADSSLDWGQDSKRLVEVGRGRHWAKVKLAYFGAVDPAVYGLDWEPWRQSDLESPQPGSVYAVNASFFQLAPEAYPPTRAIIKSWLNQTLPTGKIADSWYYFEIPGTALPPRKKDPYLVSAPFLQYRGYTLYSTVPAEKRRKP